MPAANLTHLRQQIGQVLALIGRPADFHRALSELLDLYANHAYRLSDSVPQAALLPSYHLPPLVARQVELELGSISQKLPGEALAALDTLWTDPHLEQRQLAAVMLGRVPVSHATGVLERLRAWAVPSQDRTALQSLLEQGTLNLRRDDSPELYGLVQVWLSDTHTDVQKIGLKALLPLIADPQFGNLPPCFRLLSPLVQTAPAQLFSDLSTVLQALAHRSAIETVYFLRQVAGPSANPATARLARRVLPELSPEQQESLRTALKKTY